MSDIKLTQYSHGAGCGCKISPADLTHILKTQIPSHQDSRLLVGNDSRDDAAVYDMGNGTAIISTTDFFMPIADDPFTFGKIAAANAISDVYAMGGKPILAIAILGWPIAKIPAEVAARVMDGGRVDLADEAYMPILCDPQTSGGLLIAVEESSCQEVELLLQQNDLECQTFGLLSEQSDILIKVK